jgi:hypothetical protein
MRRFGEFDAFQLSHQKRRRAIDDDPEVAGRDDMPQQVLRAAQLVVRLRGQREL